MQTLPHGAMMIVSALPLVGLGILAVVLLSMATNRDRWILPGAVAVILAVTGWGMATEYGGTMRKMLADAAAKKPAPAAINEPVDVASSAAGQPEPGDYETPTTEPEAGESATAPVNRYQTRGRHWVPVTGEDRGGDDEESRSGSRRTVVVNPAARETQPARDVSRPAPSRPPAVTPAPTPRPTPAPITPPPRTAAPEPEPAPVISRTPPREETPAPRPAPVTPAPSAAGKGNLVITFTAPLIEISQKPARSPHLLVILDGRKVEIVRPTRVKEDRQDSNSASPVAAVTYFWENLTITFPNLDAGWHVVMIDTSLDEPSSHQAAMAGAGQGANDYNGAVEIKAGKTSYMDFGAKNFMTGQFPPPKIR